MNTSDINNILATSSPEQWLKNEAEGIFFYRSDNDLTIMRNPVTEWQEFNEYWVPKLISPHTKLIRYTVKYQDSIVTQKNMVLLNGMVNVPLPFTHEDLRVRAADVNFAKIVTITPHGSLVEDWLCNKCHFSIEP